MDLFVIVLLINHETLTFEETKAFDRRMCAAEFLRS